MNQKGFIQIPLLIAIIAGVLVLGGVSYVGMQQYQDNQIGKLKQEIDDLKKQTDFQKTSAQQVIQKSSTATGLKISNPQQYKSLIDENRAQLLEATKVLSNKKIIAKVKPSVVYIETINGSGSGIIISADGYILTNAHVVGGVNTLTVKLTDNRSLTGLVAGRDENLDIALLKIAATDLVAASFSDSDDVEQGDNVFTFGFPFGIEGDVSFKEGTISRRIENYFETSAEIHPGNSGGPLVDKYGQVIGINTATFGKSIGGVQFGETIKLAIPINIAKKNIADLKMGRNLLLPSDVVAESKDTPVAQKPQRPAYEVNDYDGFLRELGSSVSNVNAALDEYNLGVSSYSSNDYAAAANHISSSIGYIDSVKSSSLRSLDSYYGRLSQYNLPFYSYLANTVSANKDLVGALFNAATYRQSRIQAAVSGNWSQAYSLALEEDKQTDKFNIYVDKLNTQKSELIRQANQYFGN